MDISTISRSLIERLKNGSMNIKEINAKAYEISSFGKNIRQDSNRKKSFENSESIDKVLLAIIGFAKSVATKKKIPDSVPEAIASFLNDFADLDLYLATETSILPIHREIIDIIIIIIPAIDQETFLFKYWLTFFGSFIRVSWFWNIFQSSDDQENLFSLINKLAMRFLISEDLSNAQQALDFIKIFVDKSPYQLPSEIVTNLYNVLPKVAEKDDVFLQTVLEILAKLIPKTPVLITLNKEIFMPPFQKSFIDNILDKWKQISKNQSQWKAVRAYLLLFITYADTMDYVIPESLVLRFYNTMEEIWTSSARRAHNLQPRNCLHFLKFDVEVFKRIPPENFAELSDTLNSTLSVIGPNTTTSDFILLLTAVAKYGPNLLPRNFWIKILDNFSLSDITNSATNNIEFMETPFIFLKQVAEIIDDTHTWDRIFIKSIDFMKNTPTELRKTFFSFLCELIKKQRISTSVAHKYQSNIWGVCCPKLDAFCEGRLKSIQLMIYYYGFESAEARQECFERIIALLESIQKAPSQEIIELMTMILCSIVQAHACQLKPVVEEKNEFEECCEQLSKLMRFGIDRPKKVYDNEKQEPVKSQRLYVPSEENSQIMEGEGDSQLFSQSMSSKKPEPIQNKQPDNISLCNFINKDFQKSFVSTLSGIRMNDVLDNYLFRLYKCVFAPMIFPTAQMLNDLAKEYNRESEKDNMRETFIFYILLFNSIADTIDAESFQPFFEKIETSFYSDLSKYLTDCDNEIKTVKKKTAKTSWKSLSEVIFSNYYSGLQDLACFISKCVVLVPESTDHLIESLSTIFNTTSEFPMLHIYFVKLLLPLPISTEHLSRCLMSLDYSFENVMYNYVVPINEREKFLSLVLDAVSATLVNTDEMQKIFRTIKKYNLTPAMKCKVLSIARDRFVEIPALFNVLWNSDDGNEEDNDPFYIMSQEQIVRIRSIDPIVSVLQSSQIEGEAQDKCDTFETLFLPSLGGVLDELEKYKEESYTSIATLTKIAANIPELTTKCIIIIIDLFSKNDPSIFSPSTIDVLFAPFSARIHYSAFLRQFLPLVIKSLLKSEDFDITHLPIPLFFADCELSKNEMQKRLYKIIAPFVVSIAVKNNKPDLIEITSRSLGISIQKLMDNCDSYLIPFLTASICTSETEEEKVQSRSHLNDRVRGRGINISSPIYLLDLLPISSEEGLRYAYQQLVENNMNRDFLDFHKILLHLYSSVYNANHTIIQSQELRKYSLYCSFILDFHSDDFCNFPWLYVDMYVLSVNMLGFAAPREVYRIIDMVGSKLPDYLPENIPCCKVLCKAFEDVCIIASENLSSNEFDELFGSMVKTFKASINNILDVMLLVPPLYNEQAQRRTFGTEFRRMACTGRINRAGIDFMAKKMYDFSFNDESLLNRGRNLPLINKFRTINEERRAGMNVLYKFIESDHYPPAVLVYTELYLRLCSSHPSPMIITGETDVMAAYLNSIASFVRDKDPEIALAALEAIRFSGKQKGIESQIDQESTTQISEYTKFSPESPRIVIPTLTDDTPWVSRAVVRMERDLGEQIVYYPSMQLAFLSPQFAREVFPQVFLSVMSNERMIKRELDEFSKFQDEPEKYAEENTIILEALVVVKNYIFTSIQDERLAAGMMQNQKWFINWMGASLNFSVFSKIALKLGDPYLAYFFAEFSRETSDDALSDSYFMKVFSKLGVKELMYDLNTDISKLAAIASIHEQEKRLERALLLYDHANIMNERMFGILKDLQLNHLLLSQGPNAEALWRLQKWEIPSATLREMDLGKHNTQIFRIMQSFASMNNQSIHRSINDFFQSFKLKESATIEENIGILLDSCSIQWFEALIVGDSDISKLFDTNKSVAYNRFLSRIIEFSKNNFQITESAAYLNGIFLSNKGFVPKLNSNIKLPNTNMKFFNDIIKVASDLHEVESAQSFVSLLRSGTTISQPADFEQLCVLNADSPLRAVALLKNHIKSLIIDPNSRNGDITGDKALQFNLNCKLTLATWYAQTHFVDSEKVLRSLNKVIDKASSSNEVEILADACITLARFEHNIHRESLSFFNSQEYVSIITIIQQLKEQMKKLQHKSGLTRDVMQIYQDICAHNVHLEQEQKKFTQSITIAINNYMKALQITEKYNLEALYGVISLWFNYSFSESKNYLYEMPKIIGEMSEAFTKINPRKFLPLFYQLAARLEPIKQGLTPSSDYTSQFQEFLHRIIKSVCYADPDVCYPVLFALTKNSDLTNRIQLSGTVLTNSERITVVEELIEEMCGEDSTLPDYTEGALPGQYKMDMRERWEQMKDLLEQYVVLAHSPQVSHGSTMASLAPELYSFKNKPYMCVITDVRHPGIAEFRDKITVLNGITKPIKIQVIATNGRKYYQILKGNRDDLRQDAVMQQLFLLSSQLLEMHNPELRIRSYKVVPLTPTSGIIECVEKSIPIGDYLIGNGRKGGAHLHYHPSKSDSFENISQEFTEASEAYYNNEAGLNALISKNVNKISEKREKVVMLKKQLFDTFNDITKRFRPVFRFFFIEKFSNTGEWFRARMNYCRHTATNSMVGYVFGIGDRHLSNILIDVNTGEVIHIDLGIAFEQGKMLKISEQVPFRLTQDVIDGFGHVGGMGIFRRSCEETLKLLRKNSEYLLTVLDVFMRDPLYNWSVIPKKKPVDKVERTFTANPEIRSETVPPKTAESIIMRCRRKLEGFDTGEILSVEGQVAQLISDATDPNKLAMMFTGWKPYL